MPPQPQWVGWVVQVQIPYDEALAPLWQEALQACAAAVLIFALTTVAAIFVARRLAAPVEQLRRAAQIVAGGDYEAPVPVICTGDELEDLASDFAVMTKSLRAAMHQQAEQARLEGVLLAARTLEHEMNNKLSLTVGYAELLERDPTLPTTLRSFAEEARQGGQDAAALLGRMRALREIHEHQWGKADGSASDRTIDLSSTTGRRGALSAPAGIARD